MHVIVVVPAPSPVTVALFPVFVTVPTPVLVLSNSIVLYDVLPVKSAVTSAVSPFLTMVFGRFTPVTFGTIPLTVTFFTVDTFPAPSITHI